MNAYVLAGGASTRMGCDKARVEHDGWPMAVHLCVLLEQAGFVAFLVRRGAPDGLPWQMPDGRPVAIVREADEGSRHPLQGVVTALAHAGAEVVVVPCDLPFLTVEALAALDRPGVAAGHPLVARVPHDRLASLRASIAAGASARGALADLPRLPVPESVLQDRNHLDAQVRSSLTPQERARRGILQPVEGSP